MTIPHLWYLCTCLSQATFSFLSLWTVTKPPLYPKNTPLDFQAGCLAYTPGSGIWQGCFCHCNKKEKTSQGKDLTPSYNQNTQRRDPFKPLWEPHPRLCDSHTGWFPGIRCPSVNTGQKDKTGPYVLPKTLGKFVCWGNVQCLFALNRAPVEILLIIIFKYLSGTTFSHLLKECNSNHVNSCFSFSFSD